MAQNLVSGANLIRPNIREGAPQDLTGRRTDFVDFLRSQGLVRPGAGSVPYKWNLETSGNASAELYAEGQSAPSPGKRTLAQVSLGAFYAQAAGAVTGHMRDQVNQGGTLEDVMAGELRSATAALWYLVETTLTGSAQDKGIASIIDAADVYGGVNPSTVTAWASYEAGSIGTLDIADLEDLYEGITGLPRAGTVSALLCNVNQLTNYGRIAGPGATTPILRGTMPGQSGSPYDLGVLKPGMAFNGAPFVGVRTITNTELYSLDLTPADDGEPGVSLVVHRDVTVDRLGKVNDDDQFLVTASMVLKVRNRRVHGKLTGITA